MNPRELLIEPLAYMPPGRALEGLTPENAERRPPGAEHSVAEIVAHLTFWQEWFLRRCRASPDPMPTTAATGWPAVVPGTWPQIQTLFMESLERAAALGDHPAMLDQRIAPPIEFPPLAGYTIRDALTHIANHNSHHLGQVITVRQLLGDWPPPSGSYTW